MTCVVVDHSARTPATYARRAPLREAVRAAARRIAEINAADGFGVVELAIADGTAGPARDVSIHFVDPALVMLSIFDHLARDPSRPLLVVAGDVRRRVRS